MNSKRRRILFGLLILMTLLLVVMNLSFVLGMPLAVSDPGGIGTANLAAWFDAGTGTFSDAGCSTASISGGSIQCWQDQSPNGLQAVQSGVGKRPTLQSNQLNSQSVVRFDGSNDVLGTGANSLASLTPAFPTANATVFLVQKSSAVQMQSSFAAADTDSANSFFARVPWSDSTVYWGMGDGSDSGDGQLTYSPFADTSGFHMWGFAMDAGAGQKIYQNGEMKTEDATADTFAPDGMSLVVGATNNETEFLSGDIAELVIYNNVLSPLDRTHVDLYLRDKYDLDLTGTGIYSAPVGYNHNVRGISASAQVTDSDPVGTSSGLRVVDQSFLQEDNDALVFGHNNAPFDCCVVSDLGSSAANRRWARLWSFNINDDTSGNIGGWVNLTFDISKAGGQGVFNPGGSYFLLKRASGSTDNFTDVVLPENPILDPNPTISGDTITFQVSVTELGSEFTVGSFDSPLAIGLNSFSTGRNINSYGLPAVGTLLVILTLTLIVKRKQRAN